MTPYKGENDMGKFIAGLLIGAVLMSMLGRGGGIAIDKNGNATNDGLLKGYVVLIDDVEVCENPMIDSGSGEVDCTPNTLSLYTKSHIRIETDLTGKEYCVIE
jgi:hypothetical protein